MLIPPMILGEWVVIPLRSQVSSIIILPKTLGEEYGYPIYDPRWEVWLSCLKSKVTSIVIPPKIPGEEYGYLT